MYGESVGVITFDFSDLERPMSGSLAFQRLISRKGAELGDVLLLDTNRKLHTGSPTTSSLLTLSNLERLRSDFAQISKPYISQRSRVKL